VSGCCCCSRLCTTTKWTKGGLGGEWVFAFLSMCVSAQLDLGMGGGGRFGGGKRDTAFHGKESQLCNENPKTNDPCPIGGL